MATGKWITFEGIEGMGKSTQQAVLAAHLEKHGEQVLCTREPGGTAVAEQIRQVLLTAEEPLSGEVELLLLYAARHQHVHQVILPALEKGFWVLCDRFNDASFAYQGGGRGISLDKIQVLDRWTLEGITPDATLLFDGPAELGFSRIASRTKDRIETERLSFFQAARDIYLQRAEAEPNRFVIIDASQEEQAVSQAVIQWVDQWR